MLGVVSLDLAIFVSSMCDLHIVLYYGNSSICVDRKSPLLHCPDHTTSSALLLVARVSLSCLPR